MKIVSEVLQLCTAYLKERNVDRARRLSEELLSHVLKLKRIDLYLQYDRPLEEKELVSLREALQRLGKGEPLEYILGEVSFFGSHLRIDRRVLIPRPETEILVDMISRNRPQGIVWDVCTGSGCIGIALKKRFPELDVTVSDISSEVLALAQENAQTNGVALSFLQGDLLEPFEGQQADLIVCNPPYVTEDEYERLDSSVRDFEPRLALVGGKSGLEFYERLAASAGSFLKKGGRLYLEIGHLQGSSVSKIFNNSSWVNPELMRDWSGKERFFSLEKQ